MNMVNLSSMINEIICDTILRKFEVNTSIAQENLRDESFYQNIDPDYRVVEDHINFLIADKTLRKIDRTVSLTTKGWFILTNYDKVGYVAQKIESVRRANTERENRLFFRWSSIICAGLLVIYIILALSNP